jgi:NADH:ubiquinone oxidoreductase subunit H
MSGALLTAVVWSLLVAAGLLAWPWLLAAVADRWAPWLPRPARAVLRDAWRDGAPVPGGVLVGWGALVLLAALLPAASGAVAADLDAGLLWVLVLGTVGWLAQPTPRPSPRAVAAVVVTLTAAVLPVVLRAATINLSDLVVAQQGGAGNWFLVREPFLLLSAGCFLVTVAALWADDSPAIAPDPWSQVLAWGRPLVAAQLFALLYLGGWWAFVPFLDGAPWLNTALKTLAVLGGLSWLRRRAWVTGGLLDGWLPAVALLISLASLAWMIVGGAVR